MAGAQKRGAILFAGLPNQIDGRLCIFRVKTGGRFICEHESRPRGKGSCHGDSLLLTDTQFPGHGARTFDPEPLKQRVRSMTVVTRWTP